MNTVRFVVVAVSALALLAVGPSSASAQGKALSLGKNADVEIVKVTRIAQLTLQPGYYRFQYQEQDGEHYLIVKARRAEQRGGLSYAAGSGTLVGRVRCMLVAVGDPGRETAFYTHSGTGGVAEIDRIAVRGERAEHQVVAVTGSR